MTIVSEGPFCLKIHLSKYEIKKYFISYNNIHINDPRVKKTISFLFDIAVKKADFDIFGKRLIEILPDAYGGCIIKFTSEPLAPSLENYEKIKQTPKFKFDAKNLQPYIFAFSNFENILKVINLLCQTEGSMEYCCDLYTNGNKYFINIYLPIFDKTTPLIFNEFSDYSTKSKRAVLLLKEYTSCLINNSALKKLNAAFFKEPLSP